MEDQVPVSVRRTWVMVLRTSASLSVSMYSDSLPAMKPQRTCPTLVGRRSTRWEVGTELHSLKPYLLQTASP